MKKNEILEKLTSEQKKELLRQLSTGKYFLKPIKDFRANELHFDAILIRKDSIYLTVLNDEFVDDSGIIYSFKKMHDELGRFFLDELAAIKYIECIDKFC